MIKQIKQTFDVGTVPNYTADNFDTYLVELDIIGIANRVFMEVPGENEDDACNVAIEQISFLKENDCSIENVTLLKS